MKEIMIKCTKLSVRMKKKMDLVTTRKTVNPHDFLDGQSPQNRAKEKLKKTLDWIYRWGFTTEKVIHLLSGQKAHTYAKSLVNRGFLSKPDYHRLA